MIKKILFTSFYFFFVVLYIHNISQDIFGGDAGDLVASSYVGGVPHPPGYPLFTALGLLLSHLPLPLLPVAKVSLISIIASIGSLFVFRKIVAFFTSNSYFQLLPTSILGLSYLFWMYTELPEVFALNVFLSLLVVYFCLRLYRTGKFTDLAVIFFLYGLGFAHHHTIFLTLPLLISIMLSRRKSIMKFGKQLLILPIIVLAGTLPYLYVVIVSSHQPIIAWVKVDSISSFLRLVLRQDYGTFSASGHAAPIVEAKWIILRTYFTSVIQSLTLPAVLIASLGIIEGLKKEKTITIGLLLSILIAGPIFIVYAGFPITDYFVLGVSERFYLLSQALLMIFFPLGITAIYGFFTRVFSKKVYAKILICVFMLIPILMFKINLPKTDFSSTRMGTNLGYDYLKSLPQGSALFLSGDTRSFNTWYVYYVLKFRNDIQLIQVGDFGIRNKMFDDVRNEISQQISVSNSDLFMNALVKVSKKRQVFAAAQLKIPTSNFEWLPTGITYQLFEKKSAPTHSEYRTMVADNFKKLSLPYDSELKPVEHSLILRSIPTNYAIMSSAVGRTFFEKYTDAKSSFFYYSLSILIDPTYSEGYFGTSRIHELSKNCSQAEKDILKAISYLPSSANYYKLNYKIARECSRDLKKAKAIAQHYESIFKESILK